MNVRSVSRSEPVRRRLRRTDWLGKVADVQSDGFKLEDAARVLEVITMHGIDRGDWTHECSDRYIVDQLGHAFGRTKVQRIRNALTIAGLITIVRRGRRTFEQGRHLRAGRWHAQGGYIRLDCFTAQTGKSFDVANKADAVRSVHQTDFRAGASNVLVAVAAAASGASGDALSMHGAGTSEVLSECNGAGLVPAGVIEAIVPYTNGVNDMTAARLNARFALDAEERGRWSARAEALELAEAAHAVRQLDGSLLAPHTFWHCRWGVDCVQQRCRDVHARFRERAAAADAAEAARIGVMAQAAADQRERERAEAVAHFVALDAAFWSAP